MKSVTSSVARNYRLQEWAAQISECQNSSQNIPEETITQSIVPVSPNLVSCNTNATVEISVGKFQISVSDTTSPEHIA